MRITHLLLVGVTTLGACYQEYQPATTPPPQFEPQPMMVQGPPGGEIDPGYAYTGPDGEFANDPYAADPNAADPNAAMGTVTDAEIAATLDGYGYWVEDAEYGRIWRPDATVVGVDFTPYETCGTWVWTDYGWTFTCDWTWGWLPFHYGYWGWFDDYWAWVPDYTWSPAWVEWRHGGGYVGWRPVGPHHHGRYGGGTRDHRDGNRGPIVRDHRGRRSGDADWRFVAERDLASGRRIRPSLVHNAEGLRATNVVSRPPIRATHPTRPIADVMRDRPALRDRYTGARGTTRPAWGPATGTRPSYDRARPAWRSPSQPPASTYQPSRGWTPPARSPSRGGYDRPTYTPPARSWSPPARAPSGTYQPSSPSRSWSPPARAPSSTYRPSPPPARSYAPSSSSSSRSYSAPSSSSSSRSHSSSGSSRGSSSSSSSSSRSSGGGRRR